MEGVLTPEVWHHVARRTGIAELNLTTRDVKDYRELMDRRVDICRWHAVTLAQIQGYIAELEPFEGAREFLDWIRERYQLLILSDTFYEFAGHFMQRFRYPTLFCHNIAFDPVAGKLVYALRQENSKAEAVRAMKALHFRAFAAGDSYNDIHMLKEADAAVFFRAPANINDEYPGYGNLQTYEELQEEIVKAL
jgi:phosphoserine / homoserine phosphotransferase